MPETRLIYIAGYNLDKPSGRNKATREKFEALKKLAGQQYRDRFPGKTGLFYPGGSSTLLFSYLKVLFFDIYLLGRLFLINKRSIVIQRNTFLPLTNIYLKIKGIKIIYELHTDMRDEIRFYNKNVLEKFLLHIFVFFEKMNICLASGLIYNHPVLLEKMSQENTCARKKQLKGKSIYTYNGSNPALFLPMNKEVCQRELLLDSHCRYYLFIGSLSKWRGVDLLINIFSKYMDEKDVLLVVGPSNHSYGEQLKKSAATSSNIQFYEEVPPAEVVKWINAVDICLVPVKPVLKSPGNPLKLYDYVACGKPIIGQQEVTGCSDEIINYGLGAVTNFYEAEQAAEDLKTFFKKHDARHYLEHNREIAVSVLAWEKRMEHWFKLAVEL